MVTRERLFVLLTAVALAVWPLFTSQTIHFYAVLSGVYALIGLSLIVLVGWTGQISLGHAALLGFGVYIGQKLLANGVPVLITILLVAAFGAVVSLALGIPSLRLRGVYLTIVTLAFGGACQRYFFVLHWIRGTNARVVPRPSIFGLSIASNRGLYYLVLVTFGVGAAIAYNLRNTDTGRTLFAIRDSEDAAQAMGIRIAPYKVAAFALSAALATVAGLFYGMLFQATPGGDQFGVLQSLLLLSIPVLGGTSSLFGAIIGGVFLAVAQPLSNEFRLRVNLLASVSLILVLWSGFDGITGMIKALWRATLDALGLGTTVRYGSFVPESVTDDASEAPRVHVTLHGGSSGDRVVRARVVSRSGT